MSQTTLPGISILKTGVQPEGWMPDVPPSLAGVDEVAIDFETTGLRWWEDDRPVGVAVGWWSNGTNEVCTRYLPWAHQGGGNLDEARVREWFSTELRGKRVINLNTRFDVHMGRAWGLDLRGIARELGDVGHYAALLDDHRLRFNLQSLGIDYLGEGKAEGLDLSKGAHVYPSHMVTPYARQDVALVIRLMEHFRPSLMEEGLLRVSRLEDRVIPAVVEMEANGMHLDVPKLEAWSRESEHELNRLQKDLEKAAGWPVNVNRPADVERLCRDRGHETDERTEKGAASYPDRVLAGFAKTDEVIAKLRDVAHVSDLRSKFLVAYGRAVGRDGIMRYSLNQLRSDAGGTVSGRFSSSALVRGERGGVNIQQVYSTENQKARTGDRWIIRELYVPPAGRTFFAADSEQIEFRLFAHYAKAAHLLEAYAKNPHVDFHQIVTDMAQQYRPGITRKQIKNVNFACVEASTPVLTSRLRWVEAGSLQPGDGLLTFDEYGPDAPGRIGARRWRTGHVLDNVVVPRECMEITLENGDVLIATPDHRWVTYGHHLRAGWVRTDELIPDEHRIVKSAYVTHPDLSWESGWLAGFFDGEGCASHSLTVHQNEGPTLDLAEELLRQRYGGRKWGTKREVGVHRAPGRFSNRLARTTSAVLQLHGTAADHLEFLSRIRPQRIIQNYVARLEGRIFQAVERAKVVRVRPAGTRLIAALGTSTATYIAAGYAAHNTIFGAGAAKTAEMMGLRVDEAKAFLQVYNQAFPEAKTLARRATRVAENRGYVYTTLGRRSRFPGRDRVHKALNAVIQGSAADYHKGKLAALYEARHELNFALRASVHDEIVGDVESQGDADRVQAFLDLPEAEMPLTVPLLWGAGTGANWREAK